MEIDGGITPIREKVLQTRKSQLQPPTMCQWGRQLFDSAWADLRLYDSEGCGRDHRNTLMELSRSDRAIQLIAPVSRW
jgi:hypothetical protein